MYAQAAADAGDERNAALLLERAEADSMLAARVARTDEEMERATRAWEEFSTSLSEPGTEERGEP
jgi:hypothetical protein